MQTLSPAYEVCNPSFSDLNIEQQITYGCNDWAAEGKSGHLYYGQSKEQAESIRAAHNNA